MKPKMKSKMVTVNALKCKYLENEAEMNFTYLWQISAHSNSTSNDLTKIFCTSSSSQQAPISTFKSFVQVMGLHSKYHDVLLPTKYLQIRLQNII